MLMAVRWVASMGALLVCCWAGCSAEKSVDAMVERLAAHWVANWDAHLGACSVLNLAVP